MRVVGRVRDMRTNGGMNSQVGYGWNSQPFFFNCGCISELRVMLPSVGTASLLNLALLFRRIYSACTLASHLARYIGLKRKTNPRYLVSAISFVLVYHIVSSG